MASQYGQHWDEYYARNAHTAVQHEWHADWQSMQHIVTPYLKTACHGTPTPALQPCAHTLIDLGCGSSALGLQLLHAGLGLGSLLLVDASPSILTSLQHHTRQSGCCHVDLLLGDCRCLHLQDGCASVIIDKGTLDALWCDADKSAMLEECARLLATPHGVLLSVSFSSPTRLRLLQQHCPRLGLAWRLHVVGAGDPARGHEVRFVTLISRGFGSVPYQPDGLTTQLLKRLYLTGSLLEDECDGVADDEVLQAALGVGQGQVVIGAGRSTHQPEHVLHLDA